MAAGTRPGQVGGGLGLGVRTEDRGLEGPGRPCPTPPSPHSGRGPFLCSLKGGTGRGSSKKGTGQCGASGHHFMDRCSRPPGPKAPMRWGPPSWMVSDQGTPESPCPRTGSVSTFQLRGPVGSGRPLASGLPPTCPCPRSGSRRWVPGLQGWLCETRRPEQPPSLRSPGSGTRRPVGPAWAPGPPPPPARPRCGSAQGVGFPG